MSRGILSKILQNRRYISQGWERFVQISPGLFATETQRHGTFWNKKEIKWFNEEYRDMKGTLGRFHDHDVQMLNITD